MTKQVLSWLTTCGTVFGMIVVGKKLWWGWLIGLLNQGLWITTIVLFGAWGLLPTSLILIYVYTKNLIAWRHVAETI